MPRSSRPGRRRGRAPARDPRPSRGPAGRRCTRDPSLERCAAAQADADVREHEVAVLALELFAALLPGRERTSVLFARALLLAGSLLRVETLGGLGHRA